MNELENKIRSREVADMMEVEHSDLLKKINGINEDFREGKVAFSKYWTESTYKVEGNNKNYKEFKLTKRGCDFLANKTIGTKGNLFTDKYMDKFELMENKIKNPLPQLSKELQSIIMLDQRTTETNARIDSLENDMPLFNVECKELQALVRKTGIKALGGKGQAYKDNSLRGRVYSDIQQQLKREFQVNRYEAIKRSQLEKARSMIEAYGLPGALWDEIIISNNQIPFSEENPGEYI